MRFLPRRLTGPAWDCPSVVPSLHRITATCGPPTTLRAAQVFTSFYPAESKNMDDAHRAPPRCSWDRQQRHHHDKDAVAPAAGRPGGVGPRALAEFGHRRYARTCGMNI